MEADEEEDVEADQFLEEVYQLPDGITFVTDTGGRQHLGIVERAVADANEQFEKLFSTQVTEAIIFIFSDITGLQDAVTAFLNTQLEYLNLHEGTPAQAWPRAIGLYTANQPPGPSVIFHELFHVLQHELANPDGALLPLIPVWMAEGNADYAMVLVREAQHQQTNRAVYQDCRGQDTPLAALEDDHLRRDRSGLEYCYGFNATELLVESSGLESIVEYWARQGQGEHWREAFANAFGRTIEEFYEEFDAWNAEGADFPDWIILPPSDDDE